MKLLTLHVTGEKQTLRSREISILTLNWELFTRFIVGLCFLTSKKEGNTVKLGQYVEIFSNKFAQARCFWTVSGLE